MPTHLHIRFATTTGNSEGLAKMAFTRAREEGFAPVLTDLADTAPADLAGDETILFFVSSYGDGDPPDRTEPFWLDLLKPTAPRLEAMRYALFGLGDRSHRDFNGFALKLDERLQALGARPFFPRHEADLDYENDYPRWADEILARISP